MKKILTILLTFASILTASGQERYKVYYTPADVRIFNEYVVKFAGRNTLPMSELVAETGRYFLGTPYVNFTLEVREPEELIVNLRELDCVTFVETAIALAQCIKAGKADFDTYCDNLRRLRYRGGELHDFTSRLHYFSDWIADNEAMGLVQDQTAAFGGLPYPISVNLMSTKPQNYRQLKAHPEMIPILKEIEENVISRRTMAYIPRTKADSIGAGMTSGLVVGTTTGEKMDITHCGFLIVEGGKPYFMHASSTEKKVVVTDITLQEYLESKRTMNGFMAVEVLAPAEPTREKVVGILSETPYELRLLPSARF